MKTKTIKARRMWANYHSHCPVPEIFDSKSRAMSRKKSYPATVTVPVAVIPLDDPMIVPALAALGIRLSKGGAK